MALPSKQGYQGPKHARDRQTAAPKEDVNRKSKPECQPGRHAWGVPEGAVWHKGVRLDYYTCSLCPASATRAPGERL